MNTPLHPIRRLVSKLAGPFFLIMSLSFAAAAEPAPVVSELAPLAFFTAHEWEAKLPDSPDGKTMSIHARFIWAEGRQAIRLSNQMMIGGKPTPYVEGLYAWNPQKKALVFMYVDAKGNFYEGTVRLEGDQLVHEFQEIHPDGKADTFVARVTPHGSESWDNAIFARKGDALTPLVQVQYLPAP